MPKINVPQQLIKHSKNNKDKGKEVKHSNRDLADPRADYHEWSWQIVYRFLVLDIIDHLDSVICIVLETVILAVLDNYFSIISTVGHLSRFSRNWNIEQFRSLTAMTSCQQTPETLPNQLDPKADFPRS